MSRWGFARPPARKPEATLSGWHVISWDEHREDYVRGRTASRSVVAAEGSLVLHARVIEPLCPQSPPERDSSLAAAVLDLAPIIYSASKLRRTITIRSRLFGGTI